MFSFTDIGKVETLAQLTAWEVLNRSNIDASEEAGKIDYQDACNLYAEVETMSNRRNVQIQRNREFQRVSGK